MVTKDHLRTPLLTHVVSITTNSQDHNARHSATMQLRSTLVPAGLTYLANNAAADSGFAATSNSYGISAPGGNTPVWTLIANCEQTNGVYNVATEINLKFCFGNHNVNLVAQLK